MKHQHKNISRRLAAAVMAGAMMVSMVGMTAFAEGDPITSLPISKIVTTDGDTYAPATSFEFTVDNGAAIEDFNDGKNIVDVTGGVTGGLTGTTITSVPTTTSDDDVVEPADSYTFSGSLAVNISAFQKPGVYHYVVTETEGVYEGIAYSEESYDVYVYVVNANNEGTVFKVDTVIAFKNGSKVSDVTFTNNYGEGSNNSTHDVTVTKVLTGTMANMSDTFSFNVGVKGASGEAYKIVYTQKGIPATTYVMSNGTTTLTGIGHNDTITIYGLTANDTYTVTETDGTSQGYTVSDSVKTDAAGTVSGKVTADNTNETITNTKNAVTPTGIAMTIAPYAIMVVAAAGVAFLFLRRRNSEF